MFQQRHFEALAQMMQKLHPGYATGPYPTEKQLQWGSTVAAMSALFRASNPRFDTARFERACIPGADVRKGARRCGPAMPYSKSQEG